jgi:taurine dioxygenase
MLRMPARDGCALADPRRLPMKIVPLSPAIGARIDGVNLCEPIDEGTRAVLRDALLAHHVLLFENQPVTPEQHRALAQGFGRLHIHPIYPQAPGVPEIVVLDNHADNLPDNDNWHTDVTFIQTPPMGSLLSARQLPPHGGDTLWSSNIAAWEALSAPMQRMLDGLHAEHDMVKSFPAHRFARTPDERVTWEAACKANPPVFHPVVRTHPESGRKGLFVSEGFTTRILDLSAAESDAVLRLLISHNARPEFTVRWRWKVGDFAFWDNRLTQHYAVADYLPHRRVMHRATILGDRPV